MIEYSCDSFSRLKKRAALNGYTIIHILFESAFKRTMAAYLFIPKTVIVNPAVIYFNFEYNDEDSFIKEVESFVAEGYVTLLIDSPLVGESRGQNSGNRRLLSQTVEELANIESCFQTILDIKGAIDFLLNKPYVDKERIAFIGYGLGATWGGVLAGVEERIKTYILIAGSTVASDWYLKSEHYLAEFFRFVLSPERYEHFIFTSRKLNALHYIKNAAPASVYFQFALHDNYISKEQSTSYFSAASSPKKISWYKTGHPFTDCPEAPEDRLNWLRRTFRKINGDVTGYPAKQNSFPF